MAAVVGVVLGIGLAAAPAALASGDTIHSGAGVQFSGVIDKSPSACSAPGAAPAIDWGDGSAPSPGTVDPSNHAVSGSHTYSAAGTYNGTITLTGGDCVAGAGPTQDSFTAVVGPAPQFPQCPPVDNDGGCQFLITATNNGTTIQRDANQPAYDDGGDDALIGIVNNTSKPISSIPLSVPNTSLFGFEQDGLCDPGSSPIPSGCQPVGSSGVCRPGDTCTFPKPPGQPAGYTEPQAVTGSTQNGYEGPRNWYSGISSDQSRGQVNFSPALQPGESTYFSLEEPPVGSSLNASATPTGITAAPPTVSSSSANFTATVNPNGSSTTVRFQYSLAPKYGTLATGGTFSQSTGPVPIGGDFSDHFVSATAHNLVPNAQYWVRVAATNTNGTSFGPTLIFNTRAAPAPGAPTIGRTFNVSTLSGIVLAKLHGRFVPVTELTQIPAGTVLDTLHGTVVLVSAVNGPGKATDAKAKKRKKRVKIKTSKGTFTGAVFKVGQARSGASRGQTTLTLVYNAAKGLPTTKSCGARRAADVHIALSSRILQTLRSRASGRYRTRGRYAAGTVRGTRWTTTDRCDGTLIAVQQHSVQVTDFVKHITVVVTAGHRYLAKAPARGKH